MKRVQKVQISFHKLFEWQQFQNKCVTASGYILQNEQLTSISNLNLFYRTFNNIQAGFRYHLNFIQNHSFSFIPASFSVGLIDLR